MNLFVTDLDPKVSALALDDKRIGKMLIEACQMMSTAVLYHHPDNAKYIAPGKLTKPSHAAHPVTVWVRQSAWNYMWTLSHAEMLANIYVQVFGRNHACEERLLYLKYNAPWIRNKKKTPFANCARNSQLDIDHTDLSVPFSYRAYLIDRWDTDIRNVTWRGRGKPEWISTKYA